MLENVNSKSPENSKHSGKPVLIRVDYRKRIIINHELRTNYVKKRES